jgi:Nif-specific regulatory protein
VSLAEGELERLARYRWPGNVRELRNVLERALVLHRDRLRPSELLAPGPDTSPAVRGGVEAVPGDDEALTLDALERKHIEAALRGEGGNLARTARRLAISISTLKRKLRRYSAA